MSALRRLAIALVAVGFTAVLPTCPAVAEPTPSASAPPCRTNLMTFTFASGIAVAAAPGEWASRSGTLIDKAGNTYSFKDLVFTFQIAPDMGGVTVRPNARMVHSATTQPLSLRRVTSPKPMWVAENIKPPTLFPGQRTFFRFDVSFPAGSTVTTYSTRLTATAAVCGDTVLASGTGMRFGFMTAGPSATAGPKPSATASAKASRKPSPSPAASDSGEEVQPPPDDVAPGDSPTAQAEAATADKPVSSTGSPLPWLAGLGVTALVCAGGLLWWLRRTRYDEDEL